MIATIIFPIFYMFFMFVVVLTITFRLILVFLAYLKILLNKAKEKYQMRKINE